MEAAEFQLLFFSFSTFFVGHQNQRFRSNDEGLTHKQNKKKRKKNEDIGKKLLRNSWEVCSFRVRQLEFSLLMREAPETRPDRGGVVGRRCAALGGYNQKELTFFIKFNSIIFDFEFCLITGM